MSQDKELIDEITNKLFNFALTEEKSGEDHAKEIIKLVRDSLIGGCILVPDGIYKQMQFESSQFRIEHPHDYSDLSQPNVHPHVDSVTTGIMPSPPTNKGGE
jgi:hypothetical protein